MLFDVQAAGTALLEAHSASVALAKAKIRELALPVPLERLDDVALVVVIICTLFSVAIALTLTRALGRTASALRLSTSSRADAIVLMGPKGSGKTCAWQSFAYCEQKFGTCTSVEINELTEDVKGKDARGREVTKRKVRVIDVPGHPKLRREAMLWLKQAKAVVFVVYSVTVANERKEVAQFLFSILSDETFQRRRLPLMLACNKGEKLTAHPPDFIRKRLEREIEAVRRAAEGELPSIAINSKQRRANAAAQKKRDKYLTLGQIPGEAFTFDAFARATACPPTTFDRLSAVKNQVEPLRDFIVSLRH